MSYSMKRKREGPGGGPSQLAVYVKPRAYKRRRANAGGPSRAPPRQWINRTPGGQITADNHYFDSDRTSTALLSNAASWTASEYDPVTLNCLFCPIQGDDIIHRTGRKIFVKKIRIDGMIAMPPKSAQVAADENDIIRIVVYQDKQTNATQSQGEDLLSSGAGSSATFMSQNLANLGRFKVWYDKYLLMESPPIAGISGSVVQGAQLRRFKITIKPMCWVNYNSTNGGTIADVIDNSFHLIANKSDNQILANISYKCRTVFTP